MVGYPGDEKVKLEAHFINGKQQGKTSYYVYLKDGKENVKEGTKTLQKEDYYENDEKVREITYFINGKKETDSYLKNGKQSQWYDNERLAIELHVENGVYNGTWKEWYTNGQIGIDGTKKSGKWIDEKKEFYPDGKTKSIEHFVEGDVYGEIYEGKQSYYDSLGNIEKTENYDPITEGEQEVESVFYYSNGSKEKEFSKILSNRGAYGSKSQFSGTYISYYENGNKSLEGDLNKKGNRDGIWTTYDKNGNKTVDLKYKDGYRNGKWKIYLNEELQETSKDSSMYYREIYYTNDGEIDTTKNVKNYFMNGQLQFEGQLLQTEPREVINGHCIYYYKDGTKYAEFFLKQKESSRSGYGYDYDNEHEKYKQGSGNAIFYKENGEKDCEGEVVEGQRNSIWKCYEKYEKRGKTKTRTMNVTYQMGKETNRTESSLFGF